MATVDYSHYFAFLDDIIFKINIIVYSFFLPPSGVVLLVVLD